MTPPSQSEIKPNDNVNGKPIDAKPIKKSDDKQGKSYFEIFQKGYKPPVDKQKNEEDYPYLQMFIQKSE